MAKLHSLRPTFAYRTYSVGDFTSIGRDISICDIVAYDDAISRKHATLENREGDYWLVDHESTNGVFVDQQRVEGEQLLVSGQIIGLGSAERYHLRFETDDKMQYEWAYEIDFSSCLRIGSDPKADIYLPNTRLANAFTELVHWQVDKACYTVASSAKVLQPQASESKHASCFQIDVYEVQIASDGVNQKLRVRLIEQALSSGLLCHDLNFQVRGKHILKDVSLYVDQGAFVGILGPSGSGKSTLLKSLNGINKTSSSVRFAGKSIWENFAQFCRNCGYVPQDDIVHQDLSVEEALWFVAALRLDRQNDQALTKNVVSAVIETLRLGHVKQQRVSSLSGGQRKRVCVGAELLTRPQLLLLDEPTAGLDPCIEEKLMQSLRELTRGGATVLITTHILYSLQLLDAVVLLCRGRVVYYGKPSAVIEHFSNCVGKDVSINQVFEILESLDNHWFEHCALGNASDHEKLDLLVAYYQASKQYHCEVESKILSDNQMDFSATKSKNHKLTKRSHHPVPFLRDALPSLALWPLITRQWLIKLRGSSSAAYLLIPLLLGMLSIGISDPAQTLQEITEQKHALVETLGKGGYALERGIQALLANRHTEKESASTIVTRIKFDNLSNLPVPLPLMVFLVMASMFMGALSAAGEIAAEKSLFRRERMALLRIGDYLFSKVVFLIVLALLQVALMYGAAWFTHASLQNAGMGNVLAFISLVSVNLVAAALGLLFSAWDTNGGKAAVLFSFAVVLPQLILMGVLGPSFYGDFSLPLMWVADALPARWGIEMMLYSLHRYQDVIWVESVVQSGLGFAYGETAFWRASFILLLQFSTFFLLCFFMLRHDDSK